VQIAKHQEQGTLSLSFVHVCALKADQVKHAERGRQASGGHPNEAAVSGPLDRSDPEAATPLIRRPQLLFFLGLSGNLEFIRLCRPLHG